MARRASAAEERRGSRAGPKSIRGRISDPIPISSPFDEMLLAKSRQAACSFVPVTKIDLDLPPARVLALANPRRSFVVGPAGAAEEGSLLPPSLGPHPNRFSDYWSPPSRLEHISQTVSEPAPPPRSELRLSVPHAAPSSDAQPDKAAGTGTGNASTGASTSTGTSIRDALRQIFGRKRPRRAEPVEPVEHRLPMQDQLKATWRLDGSVPITSVPGRPCLSREHDGMGPVTDYNRALRSHSVGLEDVLAIQSARNSIVRCQSCDSTESSCPASPLWTGPTALKPRPAATEHLGHPPSPTQATEDADEAAAPETSPQGVPSPQSSSPASDAPVLSLSPATKCGQPQQEDYFGGAEDIIGARLHTVDMSGQTHRGGDGPLGLAEPFDDPALDVADAAGLQKRLSGIEDHLHRVEALLARVCRIIPECQPRSANVDVDCKFPASMSSSRYARQVLAPDSSTGCSSPSSAAYSFSHGEASTVVDEFPTPSLRASASVPTLREEKVSSFTLGPLTALMSLIESERSSSSVMESRVRKLTQKVQLLSQNSPFCPEGRRSFGDELGAAVSRIDGDGFPAGPNPREISV